MHILMHAITFRPSTGFLTTPNKLGITNPTFNGSVVAVFILLLSANLSFYLKPVGCHQWLSRSNDFE